MWTAMLRLYKTHDAHTDKILSWTAVSLRRYLPPHVELHKYALSYCVGSFFDSCRNVYDNVLDDREVLDRFWTLARENEQSLNDKVANSGEKFGIRMKSPMSGAEMGCHMGFSSLGVIETEPVEEGGVFEIENSFMKGCIPETHVRMLFYCFAFTLKNESFWAIANNSRFIDHRLVDEFIDIFQRLVELITK